MLREKRETETDTKDAALPAKANRLLGLAFRRQTDSCKELRGQAILHTELNGTTLQAYNVVLPTNKRKSTARIDLKVPSSLLASTGREQAVKGSGPQYLLQMRLEDDGKKGSISWVSMPRATQTSGLGAPPGACTWYLRKSIPHIQGKETLIKPAWWESWVATHQELLFPLSKGKHYCVDQASVFPK